MNSIRHLQPASPNPGLSIMDDYKCMLLRVRELGEDLGDYVRVGSENLVSRDTEKYPHARGAIQNAAVTGSNACQYRKARDCQ